MKTRPSLHNNVTKPISEATMKELEASIKWYQNAITRNISDGLIASCQYSLGACIAERANRIGKQ